MVSLACAVLAWPAMSAAADTFWKTDATSGSWSTAGNWSNGIPSATNAAVFSTSAVTTTAIDGDRNAYGVSFVNLDDGIGDFTVNRGSDGVLYVYEGGISVNGGNQTFVCVVRPRTTGSIVNNGTGLLNLSGGVLVHLLTGDPAVITFGGTGNTQIAKYERRSSGMNVSIVKTGTGMLTIVDAATADAGANTGAINGPMSILGGTVAVNAEANLGFNLPTFNAAGLLLNGGALRATASFAIDDSNRGVTLGVDGGTFDVLDAAHTLTIANPIVGNGSLTKTGAGKLALTGSNSYLGGTTVAAGTLVIGVANALPTATALVVGGGMDSTTVGHLDMSGYSQTISSLRFLSNTATPNTVTIGVGQTLNINGADSLKLGQSSPLLRGRTTNATFSGGGSLLVDNASGILDVGIRNDDQNQTGNSATLDLQGLGAFTANVDELRVGYDSRINSTLRLSNTANSVTANAIQVSNSLGNNAGAGLLVFGAGTNVIQADAINIGLGKGAGTVRFASQTAGSPGTVTITDKAGTGGTNISLADNNGNWTGADITGTLDLRAHGVDVTANTVLVGRRNAAGDTGGATGTLWFEQGTFTANSLLLGVKANTGTGTARGVVNMAGGVFTVDSIALGTNTGTAGNAQGTFNLQGGTLVANSIGKGEGFGTGATDQANFNWTGGLLQVGVFGSAALPFDLNQNGGTLAPGNSVGTTTIFGNYSQAAAGTLEIELAGVGSAGVDYDVLTVHGNAALAGWLDVSLLGGFTAQLGDYFDVLTTTGSLDIAGMSLTGDLPNPVFGWWNASVVGGVDGAILRLTAIPEPSAALLALLAVGGLVGFVRRR